MTLKTNFDTFFHAILFKTRRKSAMSIFVSFLFICSAVYIGFGILLFLLQGKLIFHPVKKIFATPAEYNLKYDDVYISTSDNLKINGWFVPAANSEAYTILFCHGNAGSLSYRLEAIAMFRSLGLNVFCFDYRGYGKSEGSPSEEGFYRDAEAAWDYLTKKRSIPPSKIIIAGRSLGGAVAAYLASVKSSAAGFICEEAFTSVPDMASHHYPLYPFGFLLRYRFNTEQYVQKIKYKKLFVHSRDDEIVPYFMGEKLFNIAPDSKMFISLSGSHNNCFSVSEEKYKNALKNFLKEIVL